MKKIIKLLSVTFGNDTYNLNDQTGQADWGYNAISNGGNTTDTWRTLTSDEWCVCLIPGLQVAG